MKKIISIDAETNGLYGKAFSISAVLEENGIITSVTFRCPIEGVTNEFVRDNVLPVMEDIPMTHGSYKWMLNDFIDFYMENKNDAEIIVHMGVPVEAKLFIDAREFGFIGDFDAPYPLIDISAFPEIGTSVDTYNKNNNIVVVGNCHNPLYDCIAALEAYKSIKAKYSI